MQRQGRDRHLPGSHRRDCHSADALSPPLLKHLLRGRGRCSTTTQPRRRRPLPGRTLAQWPILSEILSEKDAGSGEHGTHQSERVRGGAAADSESAWPSAARLVLHDMRHGWVSTCCTKEMMQTLSDLPCISSLWFSTTCQSGEHGRAGALDLRRARVRTRAVDVFASQPKSVMGDATRRTAHIS